MINPSHRTANFQYAIRNIVSAAEALERQGRQVTYLNIGDPQVFGFRPPQHIVEAVQRALKDKFTGYAHSTGLLEARESIAAYATALRATTSPQDVVVTAGASEAADLVLTALLNEGDEVLLPSPGYPIYPAIMAKLGAVARYYNLHEENGWQPSVDELAALITQRSRAIVVINPNNPTGAITHDETTLGILSLAAEHDLLVISDEVYRELCFVEPPTSASVLTTSVEAPVITLESLSKTHLVPGWRLGWMRFTHGEKMCDLIAAINRLASGRLCSSTPAQYAIKPALEGDRIFMHEFVREIRNRRDSAVARIDSIQGLTCTTPQAAFYLMVKVDELGCRNDEQFVLEMLQRTAVLVVHGSGFGSNPHDGYFRLVYLADQETLTQSLTEIGRFVSSR
ncbi:MAG TPA: aminotransferase class I/II-fold pyridoxal phosphate-dependent enzyme [Pyrinomonadaceae bacterium]|nr:aminotransferase class I/II-fold pyridoxal phosphate-dependent enzyme [Pyrinomonadaceae bacterium]